MTLSGELAPIERVARELYHHTQKFPIIHEILIDDQDTFRGYLTEDFSEGSTHRILDFRTVDILEIMDMRELIGRPTDISNLTTTSFTVNGQTRIRDLGELNFGKLTNEEIEAKMRYHNRIEEYIVRVKVE